MKKIMFIFAFILLGITTASAQQGNEDLKIKPLLGVWQYAEEVTMEDGETTYIGHQIYKAITADKRYYVMMGMNMPFKQSPEAEAKTSTFSFITHEGDIVIGSENGYIEYINKHYLDNSLNNTISNLKYRFNEKNPNILYLEYNLNGNDDESWIKEVWIRVLPFGQ